MLTKLFIIILGFLSALLTVVAILFTILETSCPDKILSYYTSPNNTYEAQVVIQDCNATTSPIVRIKVKQKELNTFQYFMADFKYPKNGDGQIGIDLTWQDEETIKASFSATSYSITVSSVELGNNNIKLIAEPR